MKISCEACGAKYSIADDKVADRTLKVRCKKCSNVIIVRAVSAAPVATIVEPEPPAVAAAAAAAAEDPDAIWHVVIDQQQVGPMTTEDVAARVAAGEVGPDTYVWREGLDDWQPLAVSELAGLAPSTALDPAAAADDPWQPPEPAAPAASRLRGERNESSVLFTLGNLAQLAQPASARAAAATTATATATGSATTAAAMNEGSGLIDIRSMASAYRGDRPGVPATATASSGSMDDLPTFSTSAFAEPAVLMPSPRATARGPLIPMLLAAVAVLAIALTVLVVVVLRDHGSTAAAATPAATPAHDPARGGTEVASTAPTAPTPDPGPATTVTGSPNPTTPGPSAPPATAIPTPPGPAPAPPAPPPPAPTTDPHAKPAKNPRPHTPAPPPPGDPVTAPPKPPSDKCDQVTCMMADNKPDCCAPFRATAGTHKPPTDSNLPEELDLAAVRTAMAQIKIKAAACGAKSSAKGDVKVGVKVGPDGAVKSTTVKATPDAALGDCVAAAVKKASFPKTQRGGSFTYPQRF